MQSNAEKKCIILKILPTRYCIILPLTLTNYCIIFRQIQTTYKERTQKKPLRPLRSLREKILLIHLQEIIFYDDVITVDIAVGCINGKEQEYAKRIATLRLKSCIEPRLGDIAVNLIRHKLR